MSDGTPAVDATTMLGALAGRTDRVKLGALVTPLARRRPWKVAKEFATLMELSAGRAVLGVGLGDPPEEFSDFGEPDDLIIRATKLDEGLEVVSALLTGEEVEHDGEHFQVKSRFLPGTVPLQNETLPIWVASRWPSTARGPLIRASRWGGIFPVSRHFSRTTPLDLGDFRSLITNLQMVGGKDTEPELIHAGATGPANTEEDRELVRDFGAIGVDWWLDFFVPGETPLSAVRERIEAGPPRD